MKKNIWIFNHYATSAFFDNGGRHFSYAKYLIEKGYKVTIFCANTVHGRKKSIEVNDKYKTEVNSGINYVFIKCANYNTNGIKRIINVLDYYIGLKKVCNKFDRPDIIIGSQVHPLACLAAIQISRKLRCKCITEYRDLWPVSIIEYSKLSNNNFLIKTLYSLEKYLYIHSDGIIFTMPGGIDYLKERTYSNRIDYRHVLYLNNGVDIDDFNHNKLAYKINENNLDNNIFKIMYTGSLRLVNGIENILEALTLLNFNFECYLYGITDDEKELLQIIKSKNLEKKVFYKGFVDKKNIPYILSNSNVNIIFWSSDEITKRGISANKIFDYFAAGKPIISNNGEKYDMIEKSNCGYSYSIKNIKDYANAISKIYYSSNENQVEMGENALKLSHEFDYKTLAYKLDLFITELL